MSLKRMSYFMLVSCFFVFTVPSVNATTLQITGGNLYTLNGFPAYAYSVDGGLLWSYGQNLSASYERSSGNYTQHADNYGNLWGECVSSCKALSGNNTATSQWSAGSQVVSGGVSAGTAIATFPGGSYSGHAAIFKSYITDGYGNIIGIQVWDQNWVAGGGVFGTHAIYRTGSDVLNANNYYVVIVP